MAAFRIVAALFCFGMGWFSYQQLAGDLASLGTREAAERLNLGETISNALVETLSSGHEYRAALENCRSDILDAAVILQLRHIDNVNRATDDTRWQEAMERAQTFVTHALGCNPADGNLWLRDAMLVHGVAEQPEAVVKRLALSADLVSSYLPVVQARIALWSVLSPATQELGKDLMDNDLRIMVFYFPPYQTAAILKAAPDLLKSRALAYIPMLPEDRKSRLLKAISET
jgi:hypothetical protein